MDRAFQSRPRATDSRSRRKARSTRIGYLLGSSPPAPRVGPVTTTGAAFSTGVRLPGSRPGDGIAIAQTAANSHIADLAALRSVLPRIDREVRGAPIARVIGPGVAHEVGGRPAVTWTLAGVNAATAPTDGEATFVFSSASNVVVVNCRWPHAGSGRAALRKGCDAVLATLAVG